MMIKFMLMVMMTMLGIMMITMQWCGVSPFGYARKAIWQQFRWWDRTWHRGKYLKTVNGENTETKSKTNKKLWLLNKHCLGMNITLSIGTWRYLKIVFTTALQCSEYIEIKVSHCSKVKSVHWLHQWQGHLSNCPGQLKSLADHCTASKRSLK